MPSDGPSTLCWTGIGIAFNGKYTGNENGIESSYWSLFQSDGSSKHQSDST